MIQNRWKTVLARKGITQAAVAEKAGLNKPFFSGVVNGVSVLSYEELQKVCEILDIEPSKVYSADVMNAVYGTDIRKPEQVFVTVKLSGYHASLIEELKQTLNLETNVEVVRTALVELYKSTWE